jgi:hypothetical protein
MGNIRIVGNIIGGSGPDSGGLWSEGNLANVRVGGDVLGGSGPVAGFIVSLWSTNGVRIGGSVIGAGGDGSAVILGYGAIGDVLVGGDLFGGAGDTSGVIASDIALGHVLIAGDIVGGSVSGTNSLHDSGRILSNGRIASVTVLGSLVAGSNSGTGVIADCGTITAGDDIGAIKIGGGILGNSANPAFISARGQKVKPAIGYDIAIASLSVKGDVRYAQILGGFDEHHQPANADASIGAVTVGGDWAASSIVAGAENLGADDLAGGAGGDADNVNFGDGHDFVQSAADSPLVSRIASITIMGDVGGSFAVTDHFAFVAQQIGALKVGGKAIALAAGSANDNVAMPFVDDVLLLEVS